MTKRSSSRSARPVKQPALSRGRKTSSPRQKSLSSPPVFTTGKLSTDYLNRFNEIMMVIDLAASSPDMLEQLNDWRRISYVEHFETSGLRHLNEAIAGYWNLPDLVRQEFDVLVDALNRLADITIAAMTDAKDPMLRQSISQIAVQAFGYHITRAAAFINSNGDKPLGINVADLQQAVDNIMACGG